MLVSSVVKAHKTNFLEIPLIDTLLSQHSKQSLGRLKTIGRTTHTTTSEAGRAVEIKHNYGQSKIFPDKNARAPCVFFDFFFWEMKETAEGV